MQFRVENKQTNKQITCTQRACMHFRVENKQTNKQTNKQGKYLEDDTDGP